MRIIIIINLFAELQDVAVRQVLEEMKTLYDANIEDA